MGCSPSTNTQTQCATPVVGTPPSRHSPTPIGDIYPHGPGNGPTAMGMQIGSRLVDARRCKQNIIVALDTSGSMHDGRLDSAKQGFLSLINSLYDDDNVMVFAFNHEVRRLTEGFVSLNPQSRQALVTAVYGLQAGGQTSLYEVIMASTTAILQVAVPVQLATKGSAGRFTVVVLTDGADNSTDSNQKLVQCVHMLETANAHLGPNGTLSTQLNASQTGFFRIVFVGVALLQHAQQKMQMLVSAAGSSARYHDVRDGSGIARVFQDIIVRVIQDDRIRLQELLGLLIRPPIGTDPASTANDDKPSSWAGDIQRGSHVRCVGRSRSAAGVAIGDVGVVQRLNADGCYVINFPTTDGWCADHKDVVLDVEADKVRPGAIVAVKRRITPAYEWGNARGGMRGLVVEVTHDGKAKLQLGFNPNGGSKNDLWTARLNEVVVIRPDEPITVRRPGKLNGPIQIGDAVRVRGSVSTPTTGWGGLKQSLPRSIGYVRGYDTVNGIFVCDFPEQDGVKFRVEDIEIEAIANRVRPGQRVRVRDGINAPKYSWGNLRENRNKAGVVRSITYDGTIVVVDFGGFFWKGLPSELQATDRQPATERDRDPDSLNCRMLHGLRSFRTTGAGHSCDFCARTNIAPGTTMYGCRKCDVDACVQCHG